LNFLLCRLNFDFLRVHQTEGYPKKEEMTPIHFLLVDNEQSFIEIMKQKSSKH
jgi:hypothetical protein